MAVTVKTTTSYGDRVKNSFKGIGTGILMFVIGTCVLFWNEGRTVKTTRMLKGAQKVCVEGDVTSVNSEFEGKLIHAVATASTKETLSDDMFPVSIPNAIKLDRSVEYYQWVEHSHSETKDKVGGGQETITTYTYSKEWCGSPVNSSNFQTQYDEGHSVANRVVANIDDKYQTADVVDYGAYVLDDVLKGGISCSEPVTKFYITEEYGQRKTIELTEGVVEPAPEIGDVRVTFKKGMGGVASILAVPQGNTFTKYYDVKNDKSLETLYMGTHAMDEMFASEHQKNKMLGWILRLVGILLIVGGIKNILGFVETIAKVLPFVANIIGFGISLIAWVIGLAWSLLIIGIGCLFYRPLLGVVILGVVAALVYFLVKKNKEKKAADAAAAAAAPAPAPAPVAPAAPVAEAPAAPVDEPKAE